MVIICDNVCYSSMVDGNRQPQTEPDNGHPPPPLASPTTATV